LVQISFCLVSLYSSVSLDLAQTIVELLQKSAVGAAGIVFVCHALVPAPPPGPRPAGPPPPPGLPPVQATWAAASDLLVLLPPAGRLDARREDRGLRHAHHRHQRPERARRGRRLQGRGGRLAAAVLAATVAVVVQQFVLTSDTLVQFFLAVFVVALWLAPYILRGGQTAAAFSLALSTYVLLLGIAVTPLPGGSEESSVMRVIRVAVAGLYALGLLNLFGRLRRAAAAAR
jgi:hypothetical protein